MKILFLAAEATPWVKVGGLADVAGELPPALRRLDLDVRLALPRYPALELDSQSGQSTEFQFSGQKASFLLQSDQLLLIDGTPIRAYPDPYHGPEDDVHKFVFFSLAALHACRESGWRPDLVHANDWHTAAAVIWLAGAREQDDFWRDTRTLLTVHNLPYMGAGGEAALEVFGLSPVDDPHLPAWAQALPLPAGLACADWLSTVSPSYAQEMQSAEFGCGLEGLLRARTDRLRGILNGIDLRTWDPATDSALVSSFDLDHLQARPANKQALQQELGLPLEADTPLIVMITRLDHQKGVDLALEALAGLEGERWQFVLIGTGRASLEDQARAFADQFPARAHFVQRFDTGLASRMYAGGDLILIPSRYEPCGLAQMIAMRYGNIPVVRATGGLRDTVQDIDADPQGNGFRFDALDPIVLSAALKRALDAYRQPQRWKGLQRRVMAKDFSWERSAQDYRALYQEVRETPL